jgi:hypothetical protein
VVVVDPCNVCGAMNNPAASRIGLEGRSQHRERGQEYREDQSLGVFFELDHLHG